ncbi:hypothetical protein D3C73_830250 [compost metagenome]
MLPSCSSKAAPIGPRVAPMNKINVYNVTAVPLEVPPSWPIIEISVGTVSAIPATKMMLNIIAITRPRAKARPRSPRNASRKPVRIIR